MPRYRFALDGSMLGTFEQFANEDDAKRYASRVADEINRNSSKKYCILVFDEVGQLIERAETSETSGEDALKQAKFPGEEKPY